KESSQRAKWGAIFRHHLLFVAWGLMEVALIVPLAYALMGWLEIFQPVPLTLSLLVLILIPLYFSTLLTKLRVPMETQQQIMIVTVIFIIIWAIRTFLYGGGSSFDFSWVGQLLRSMTQTNNNAWHSDVGLFAIIAVCWWRGMLLITRELNVTRFGEQFRTGGLFIAPLILLTAALRLDWSVLGYLLLFLFSGLTAVALTRIEQAERDQVAILDSIGSRWLLTIFGSGLVIILLPSALSFAINGAPSSRIGNFFTPLWLGLQFAFSSTLFTVAFLISPLLAFFESLANRIMATLQWLFSRVFVPRDQPLEEQEDPAEMVNELIAELQRQAAEDGYSPALDWNLVLLILLFLLVIGVAIWLVQRYRGNRNKAKDGRFDRTVGGLFSNNIPSRSAKDNDAKKSRKPDWRAALTIRRIYAQMSQLAADLDTPREKNETPYEFLSRLATLWPNHENEVSLITQAFVKVRYGELPENQEEFEAIKHAWELLKRERINS
ncbi:MAG: DUF4129 domain-containing protein, partial [Chloroflexota bacterium]